MKKIYLLLMVAVMSLGFVSCSDDDPDGATINICNINSHIIIRHFGNSEISSICT